jgi:hypothetical protein
VAKRIIGILIFLLSVAECGAAQLVADTTHVVADSLGQKRPADSTSASPSKGRVRANYNWAFTAFQAIDFANMSWRHSDVTWQAETSKIQVGFLVEGGIEFAFFKGSFTGDGSSQNTRALPLGFVKAGIECGLGDKFYLDAHLGCQTVLLFPVAPFGGLSLGTTIPVQSGFAVEMETGFRQYVSNFAILYLSIGVAFR